jgi:hypothetical protein
MDGFDDRPKKPVADVTLCNLACSKVGFVSILISFSLFNGQIVILYNSRGFETSRRCRP